VTPEMHKLSEHPLVSVIIPAYNAEKYIGSTLQSLQCQSYENLEIIVVDDGSHDQTSSIVKSRMKKDRRIRYFRQSRQGVASSRNLALQHSKGDFIAPVDADDICFPQKIEKLLKYLKRSSKKVGLVYSWCAVIDQQGNLTGSYQTSQVEGKVFYDLLFSNFIGNGSACMIRKNCFDTVGLYNISFFKNNAQGCEDYDLYLRIAEKFDFKVVKAFLTGYRITDNGMTADLRAMEKSRLLVIKSLLIRYPEIPHTALRWTLPYFLFYLSHRAEKMCNYIEAIKFLLKAAKYDKALIFNNIYIRMLTYNIMRANKIPLRPLISFKKNLKSRCLSISNQQMNSATRRFIQKIYLLNQRSSFRLIKEKRRNRVYQIFQQAKILKTDMKLTKRFTTGTRDS
jgi:glycosyltransferase involved in cell wall biosynthesis